jgi:hypothetical protein
VTRTYRCQACGAGWVSYPGSEAVERQGRCLRCDGALVLDEPPERDPAGPRAETDASPPVPNGLEDDAET